MRQEQELAQAQEERLAAELERIRLEQTRDERLRQYVRQTAPELRELERKLQAGYVNREVATQRMEKQAQMATARQNEIMAAREMQELLQQAEEEGGPAGKARWRV